MTWWFSNNRALAPIVGIAALTLISGASDTDGGKGVSVKGAPRLGLPVACDMTRDCSIQKYVDHAPGPDRLDYHCGTLTTDGHDGIDFRLRRAWDMQRTVAVVAAAPGKVLRVRDGMPDISVRNPAANIGDRLAGNAVVIDHGGGWESQYSHLKSGSVNVRPGDVVRAGYRLGAVGISGNAEFPHLHFEVRYAGKSIDPFSPSKAGGCGSARDSLWLTDTHGALQYKDTIVLATDFASSVDQAMNAYQMGERFSKIVNPDRLLIWGITSGVKSGDTDKFQIFDPKGGQILDSETNITQNNLQRVAYAGLKRPQQGWTSGHYRGVYTLIRNGKTVGFVENAIFIQDD